MWGITNQGGTDGVGTLFSTASDGSGLSVKYSFQSSYQGADPTALKLERVASGKLYGVTPHGGIYGSGVLFEYDPVTGIYTKKYDFPASFGNPQLGLTLASNNKLYGTAAGSSLGIIYEYDPATNAVAIKYSFTNTAGQGSSPYRLIAATNGKLYGTTFNGGSAGAINFTRSLSCARDAQRKGDQSESCERVS